MDKNKYTFAQELLRSYKLTPEQKEQVLALVARERNEDIVRLEEKVASLEKNTPISEKEEPDEIEKEVKIEDSLPKYIYPFSGNGLATFLLAYNQDPLLKYTCHTIDEGEIQGDNIVDYIKKIANIDTYTVREHQHNEYYRKGFMNYVILIEMVKNYLMRKGKKRINIFSVRI